VLVAELTREERDLAPAAHHPPTANETTRLCRGEDLYVQVRRGCPFALRQCCYKRRPKRVVEHPREQAALDHARRVQERSVALGQLSPQFSQLKPKR
jgi:hypothetical protein